MATVVSQPRENDVPEGRPASDAALVDALRAGDRDAFEQLYALYRGQIYNLTLRIVRSPDDACDITQDVFIKVFRKLPDSPVTDLHLKPWLYRVAVNASYDHLRTRRQHRDIDDLGTDARAVPVDGFEQAETSRRVEQTLAALSERHRTVLVLKDFHGLRHDEIAEILGISRNATETLLFRARAVFRERYTELTHEQPGSAPAPKWTAAGVGLGMFLHEFPLPPALQGGFPFAGAGAGAGGAGVAAGGASGGGASTAGTAGAGAAAASAGAAGGSSAGLSLAAGGLLAKVSGVVGAKIAVAIVATTCVTGSGVVAYETGFLPGPLHRPHTPPAQTHRPAETPGEQSVAKTRGDKAANGAARSAAARERAAAKKAAAADKAHGNGAGNGKHRANGKADGSATSAAAKSGDHGKSGAHSGNANGQGGGNGQGNANGQGGGNAGGHEGTKTKPDKPKATTKPASHTPATPPGKSD